MRKSIKTLCLIIAALIVAGTAFFVKPVRLKAAGDTPEHCHFTITGEATDYSYASDTSVLTITGDVTIEMSDSWKTSVDPGSWESWDGESTPHTTQQRIVIDGSGPINVTINNIRISAGDGYPAISLQNGANAVISLVGKNFLESDHGHAALHAPQGTTLTINAAAQSGYLLCAKKSGASGGAGIGGSNGESGGAITISGEANVVARGADGGAGIGGGAGGTSGKIRLDGNCKITAESQPASGSASGSRGGGAAIGGGANAGMTDGDTIYIGENVTLTAKGANGGAHEAGDYYAGGGAAIGAGGGSAANNSYALGGKVLGTITIVGGETRPGLSLAPGIGGAHSNFGKKAGNGATVGDGGDAYNTAASTTGGDGAPYQAAKPTVLSVTPSGTSVAANTNELVITFSGPMNGSIGTVQMNGADLTIGAWDTGNKVIRCVLSDLRAGTNYTVQISDFFDVNGTKMVDYTHTFETASDQLFAPTNITPLTYTCASGKGGSVQLTATGASPAAKFSAANPPAGVTLSESGLLTIGSSAAAGRYTFAITAQNSEGSITKDFTLKIEAQSTPKIEAQSTPTPTKPPASKPEILPSGVKIGMRDGDTYPTVTRNFTGGSADGNLSASITTSQITEMLGLVEKNAKIKNIFPRCTLEFIWDSDAPDISITIGADALKLMAESSVDKFFVQTGSYQFAFDPDALRTLSHKGDVTIRFVPYVPGESESALNLTTGIRKAARVTVTSGGEEISALSNGRMYGAIRYKPALGERVDGLFACAVNESGGPAWIAHSGYCAGYVAWNTTGLSGVYGLGMSGAYRGTNTSFENLWIGPANAPVGQNLPVFGS